MKKILLTLVCVSAAFAASDMSIFQKCLSSCGFDMSHHKTGKTITKEMYECGINCNKNNIVPKTYEVANS